MMVDWVKNPINNKSLKSLYVFLNIPKVKKPKQSHEMFGKTRKI